MPSSPPPRRVATRGDIVNEHHERTGPFWDAVDGRAPMPPVAGLLGWELQEVDPQAGTIVVKDTRPAASATWTPRR